MNENYHILIVDDDNRIRELIKEYLEENNFIVSTANNAEEASEKIKLVDFEIVVLDIMMPGESGIELTKKLRKNISTPIILLTAKGEVDDRIIGLESGADDYLVKPFSPKELLLRINALFLNLSVLRNLFRLVSSLLGSRYNYLKERAHRQEVFRPI